LGLEDKKLVEKDCLLVQRIHVVDLNIRCISHLLDITKQSLSTLQRKKEKLKVFFLQSNTSSPISLEERKDQIRASRYVAEILDENGDECTFITDSPCRMSPSISPTLSLFLLVSLGALTFFLLTRIRKV